MDGLFQLLANSLPRVPIDTQNPNTNRLVGTRLPELCNRGRVNRDFHQTEIHNFTNEQANPEETANWRIP